MERGQSVDDWDDSRITSRMRRHILYGSPNGTGGHRYDSMNPNMTVFPEDWTDYEAMSAVSYTLDHHYADSDNAQLRDLYDPNFRKLYGYIRGVRILVRLDSDGNIATTHPLDGEGVFRTGKRDGAKREPVPLGTVRNVPLPP